MPRATAEVGLAAEQTVCRFLRRRGLRVIETRFRWRRGEIDIIARDGATYVFVEVRARQSGAPYRPGATVNGTKQRSVIRAAEAYLAARRLGQPPCRFDVAEVFLDADQQPERIELIENAFLA